MTNKKHYSWLRKAPQLETSPEAMDAIIVAAQMDGCWKVLDAEQGVTRVDGITAVTNRMSLLMTWLATDEEREAWERLLEIAQKITAFYDEDAPPPVKARS